MWDTSSWHVVESWSESTQCLYWSSSKINLTRLKRKHTNINNGAMRYSIFYSQKHEEYTSTLTTPPPWNSTYYSDPNSTLYAIHLENHTCTFGKLIGLVRVFDQWHVILAVVIGVVISENSHLWHTTCEYRPTSTGKVGVGTNTPLLQQYVNIFRRRIAEVLFLPLVQTQNPVRCEPARSKCEEKRIPTKSHFNHHANGSFRFLSCLARERHISESTNWTT